MRPCLPPRTCAAGICDIGSHTWVLNGNCMPGGMTPTIVDGSELTRTVRPITDGSPPYRLCQTVWLRSITEGAPGRSSSSMKPRPMAARAPMRAKPFAEMNAPSYRSGARSSALTFMGFMKTIESPENVRVARRQSS